MRKDGGRKVNIEKVPEFATEEQEAEYWDTHSPLDVAAEPEAQEVRVRVPKDRPITIRLDSETRRKLEKLAAESGLGPSTFARLILMSAIERGSRLKVAIPAARKRRPTTRAISNLIQAHSAAVRAAQIAGKEKTTSV